VTGWCETGRGRLNGQFSHLVEKLVVKLSPMARWLPLLLTAQIAAMDAVKQPYSCVAKGLCGKAKNMRKEGARKTKQSLQCRHDNCKVFACNHERCRGKLNEHEALPHLADGRVLTGAPFGPRHRASPRAMGGR